MDWQRLIKEMRKRDATLSLAQIARECGMSSSSHVHDLLTGRKVDVLWGVGDAIITLPKRVMRRGVVKKL